jgi:hypothetical protein
MLSAALTNISSVKHYHPALLTKDLVEPRHEADGFLLEALLILGENPKLRIVGLNGADV